jgi:amino-acid N-acetyltransferase
MKLRETTAGISIASSEGFMEEITYSPASANDMPAVRALLEQCGLPTEDLKGDHLGHFILCRSGGRVAGTVGLELLGDLALLRSLAVAPELRNRRIGHELWDRALAVARRLEVRQLYLLTTTAEGLFVRWGFRRVPRESVPEVVRQTSEYSAVCPSTAAVMTMDVSPSPPSVQISCSR